MKSGKQPHEGLGLEQCFPTVCGLCLTSAPQRFQCFSSALQKFPRPPGYTIIINQVLRKVLHPSPKSIHFHPPLSWLGNAGLEQTQMYNSEDNEMTHRWLVLQTSMTTINSGATMITSVVGFKWGQNISTLVRQSDEIVQGWREESPREICQNVSQMGNFLVRGDNSRAPARGAGGYTYPHTAVLKSWRETKINPL